MGNRLSSQSQTNQAYEFKHQQSNTHKTIKLHALKRLGNQQGDNWNPIVLLKWRQQKVLEKWKLAKIQDHEFHFLSSYKFVACKKQMVRIECANSHRRAGFVIVNVITIRRPKCLKHEMLKCYTTAIDFFFLFFFFFSFVIHQFRSSSIFGNRATNSKSVVVVFFFLVSLFTRIALTSIC